MRTHRHDQTPVSTGNGDFSLSHSNATDEMYTLNVYLFFQSSIHWLDVDLNGKM